MGEQNSEISGLIILGVVALIVWGVSSFIGGEREGIVKYDDCRQQITLQPSTWQKYYKKFTCDYLKSNDDKILGGICVHVENDSSLLGSNHSCSAAYVYERKSDVECPDLTNGYLNYSDGKCYCNNHFQFNNDTQKCNFVPLDQSKVIITCNYGKKGDLRASDTNVKFDYSDFDDNGIFIHDFDKNEQIQKACQMTQADIDLSWSYSTPLFTVVLNTIK